MNPQEVTTNPTDKNGCPIKCGDNIFVDPPSSTDDWNCEFEGTAESFRHEYVVVVDMAGDHWDIEPEKLTVI